MPKIQFNHERYFVTIPKEIVAQCNWSKGDVVTASFNERGNVELKKVNKR